MHVIFYGSPRKQPTLKIANHQLVARSRPMEPHSRLVTTNTLHKSTETTIIDWIRAGYRKTSVEVYMQYYKNYLITKNPPSYHIIIQHFYKTRLFSLKKIHITKILKN